MKNVDIAKRQGITKYWLYNPTPFIEHYTQDPKGCVKPSGNIEIVTLNVEIKPLDISIVVK